MRHYFHDYEAQEREDRKIAERAAKENAQFERAADLSTEELRRRAIKQEREAEAKQALEARQREIIRLVQETPELVNSEHNRDAIIGELQRITGRKCSPDWEWTRDELHQAVDAAYEAGNLELRGPYRRKAPSERELYEMPRQELENLIRFGSEHFDPLQIRTKNHE